MMKKMLPYLLVLVAVLLPSMAWADPAFSTLKPNGDDLWTLRVFGNGDAIRSILEAIKLLMVPEGGGGSGFNTLMTLLATLGFLVLAVQAGFDPAKNLMKMFGYILVVATVHILTINVRANVSIVDQVSGQKPLVVLGVPALVAVPSALVSQVGHWFTKNIETNYTIPSALTTTTGGAFNLFGRMMQESNEYVITNAELKKSLSAYVADCAVPAMARGQLSASELMTSKSMVETLGRASHKAILTKYWAQGTPNSSGTGVQYPSTIEHNGISYPTQGGMGAVLPCEAAWSKLGTDLESHAQELLNGSAANWAKTGVMVPFEHAMSVSLAQVASGGANGSANYSKPQGFILQQAMLNSMNGSFRSAAASIGNNDLLMAASIAQAEQSQKSAWFTAGRVFTNMMGYVYTTLQAFIFAIVPIVVVSLMVPGLGKSIFTNYAQILVWLTLWQPMLSIVNFLITLFGQEQMRSAFEMAGGITMQNKWVITEQTNDLMLAAQFLGTSVPLLTWGLVKGSLAFTEFISNGIGSSMAQQAGATAATGNMSMNNMSMDNASMNKFNTAMSSAVGAQTTMGYTGAAQSAFDSGGLNQAENGGQKTNMASQAMQVQRQQSLSQAASLTRSAAENQAEALALSKNNSTGENSSLITSKLTSSVYQLSEAYSKAEAAKDTKGMEAAQQAMMSAGNALVKSIGAKAAAGIDISTDKAALGKVMAFTTGVSAKGGFSTEAGQQAAANLLKQASDLQSYKHSKDVSTSDGLTAGGSKTESQTRNQQAQHGRSSDENYSVQQQASLSSSIAEALSASQGASDTLSASESRAVTSNAATRWNAPLDDARMDAVPGSVARDAAHVRGEVSRHLGGSDFVDNPGATPALTDQHRAMADASDKRYDNSGAQAAPGMVANNPVQQSLPNMATPNGVDVSAGYDNGKANARAAVDGVKPELTNQKAALDKDMAHRKDTGAIAGAQEIGGSGNLVKKVGDLVDKFN